WLVSGNENVATFSPTDVVDGLTAAASPLDEIKDASGRPHRILVKASAGVTGSSDATALQRVVTAPQVAIESLGVPGTDGTATPVGHYAWWVGDEGVKARANLIDSYAADSSDTGKLRRRTSAQRPAVEGMTTDGTDDLATHYPANHASLKSVIDGPQLELTNPLPVYRDRLRLHYHDLTTWSRGVIADTRHGGLKHDLSYILGQPTRAGFVDALSAAYEVSPGGFGAAYNPALSPLSTPYATLPADDAPADYPYGGANGIFKYGATWEQLWSFHHMSDAAPSGVYDGDGHAVPRLQNGTQHGVYPVVVQAKLFYRLRIVGGDENAPVNRTGEIWVDVMPLVVIANPCAVPLAAADYTVTFAAGGLLELRYGTDPAPTPGLNGTLRTAYPKNSYAGSNLPALYTDKTRFVLRSEGMEAGEARVFTIDPDLNDGDLTVITRNNVKKVYLHNDYDPIPAITFNTGQKIPAAPAPMDYVALYTGGTAVITKLYLGTPSTLDDRSLVHYSNGQAFTADSAIFLVNPMSKGVRQGGGFITALNEAPTTASTSLPEQAPFYQVNYRALVNNYTGSDQVGHPVEWARTYAKSGDTVGDTEPSNPQFEANLLRPFAGAATVRWGLVNLGSIAYPTVPPASIGGAGAGPVGFQTLLYDLPPSGQPASSLGQLQHFNTTGHIPDASYTNPSGKPVLVNSWQVNYPISNSYPHPRIPRDRVFNASKAIGYHFDGSYLWNDVLWDRFYFSTYPQTGPFDFATDKLTNNRYRPFRDTAAAPLDDPAPFRGSGPAGTPGNSRLAAQNLLIDGAFNINSTSTDAWKAVFSSLRSVPTGGETTVANLTAPFARTAHQTGDATGTQTGKAATSWNGVRNLTYAEIDDLAAEMVLQVRKRGPFLSLADFVNRRLIPKSDDTHGLGLSGALQAALDRSVNKASHIDSAFRVNLASTNYFADPDFLPATPLLGFPGHVLQADVLSATGPSLAARSDTFTIRAYGDVLNPATAEIVGRAWCEAVVQRTPDYVASSTEPSGNSPDEIPAANSTNDRFGRRYQVVSFRWLNPADL
ncbi:MAG TPA: hypothetical protein VIO38_10350, partial [Rariglobus sp.]